ncbi:MAG: MFS transporter [Opitutaceae bacterium]|nr:MFS transporter [Opitutaceae bacterium]
MTDSPAGGTPPRTWTVGTLTYTTTGLALLVVWLLWGDIAWWTRDRSAMPMMQVMLKLFDASDLITGLLLITVPSVIAMTLGPLISYWSDNHRSRYGRRIPFLLGTTPLIALSMVGLGLSPELAAILRQLLGWGPERTNTSVLIVLGICWTTFELGALTANSIFAALINDVVPRVLIGRFFGVFRAVSLAVGIAFNSFVIGLAEQHFRIIFIAIGLFYGAGLTLMCFRVREGDYPPVPPERAKASILTIYKTYLRECFTCRHYVLAIVFFALGNLAYVPINIYAVATAKSLGMSMETFGKIHVVMYLTSFVLAFPLGWLADRFHPQRVSMGALLCSSSAALISFFALKSADDFFYAMLAHGVFSGCFFTGIASFCQVIFPKLRCAQFIAAAWIVNSLMQIIFGPAFGWFLDFTGNQYRYAFLAGSCIGAAALAIGIFLLRSREPVEPAAHAA